MNASAAADHGARAGDAGKGFYVSTGFYADNPDENIQSFIAACKAIDAALDDALLQRSTQNVHLA